VSELIKRKYWVVKETCSKCTSLELIGAYDNLDDAKLCAEAFFRSHYKTVPFFIVEVVERLGDEEVSGDG